MVIRVAKLSLGGVQSPGYLISQMARVISGRKNGIRVFEEDLVREQ